MRFQTSETIPLQDPEIVLSVLETCLRHISSDVVRSGPEITLYGLGPSPRAVNQRDITILRVQAEHDRTVINADVTFQASAFLGEASQDEIVRSKLDRVFEQMKLQLPLEHKRTSSPLPSVQPPSIPPTETPSPHAIPAPTSSRSIPQRPPEPNSEPKATSPQPSPPLAQDHPTLNHPTLDHRSNPPSTSLHLSPFLIAAVCLLLIASIFYFLHRPSSPSTPSSPPPTASRPAAPLPVIKPVAPSKSPIVPPPTTNPPSPSTLTPADPKVWLEGWVAAMRTRDPVAQASFYADPVDRYLGRHDVSNALILQDKKNAIHNREGLWTVKLENITLAQQTDTTVVIHLTKHYIAQTEPAQISEQFVHSRLQLTRLDGQWKITSEQDVP